MLTPHNDPIIWRNELQRELEVSSETIRRWERGNKLPAPDIDISRKRRGWRLSTLRKFGINLAH